MDLEIIQKRDLLFMVASSDTQYFILMCFSVLCCCYLPMQNLSCHDGAYITLYIVLVCKRSELKKNSSFMPIDLCIYSSDLNLICVIDFV